MKSARGLSSHFPVSRQGHELQVALFSLKELGASLYPSEKGCGETVWGDLCNYTFFFKWACFVCFKGHILFPFKQPMDPFYFLLLLFFLGFCGSPCLSVISSFGSSPGLVLTSKAVPGQMLVSWQCPGSYVTQE